MRNIAASKLKKIVQQARDQHGKVIVFLGGSCDDNNAWRKNLDEQYGDYFFFIDPFDEDWDPEDNIYDELAGMVNADYIIFYKGGKQTEREKAFLESIGRKKDLVKEFEDLGSLKKYLDKLKKIRSVKACVSTVLQQCAWTMAKNALLDIDIKGKVEDLHLENMDSGSINEFVDDLERGETVLVPELSTPKGIIGPFSFSKRDLQPESQYFKWLDMWRHKPKSPHEFLEYDKAQHSYRMKQAKVGVTYKSCSTQVDLPEELSKSIMAWGQVNVPDKSLYTKDKDKGRENEIHVTLFYGIQEDSPDKIKELLSSIKPFTCRLGIVTAFKDKKEYDVLKIDVESPEMVKLHYLIEDSVKNKTDYPTYTSHLTIAYVKKGEANRFIGEDRFRGVEFKVTEVTYSTKDHIKIKIPLGI